MSQKFKVKFILAEFHWTVIDSFLHFLALLSSFEATITLELSRIYTQGEKGVKFQIISLLTFDSWNWPLGSNSSTWAATAAWPL